ncbi:MAG: hypothetical protein IT306_15125 [Chloroflexi bacterium]|nr:hypothetical protein [Chloroflexota bacterium]
MGFDPAWLSARRRYDEAALDAAAIRAIRDWAAALPEGYVPIVVDLGSGTGAALRRARAWLAPRPLEAYAVDRDAALLALATPPGRGAEPNAAWSAGQHKPASTHLAGQAGQAGQAGHECRATRIVADLLQPLDSLGGPPDGTADLVLGHALADLLPLDRLAARAAALARPGGLIHLALAYDGQTCFGPSLEAQRPGLAEAEQRILNGFHQHMDRPRAAAPAYGGATSGRRLAPALRAAGLEIVREGASVWNVAAADGPDARLVLDWLLRFVSDAARDLGRVDRATLDAWEACRRAMLADGTLTARVVHRDVLARRAETPRGDGPLL